MKLNTLGGFSYAGSHIVCNCDCDASEKIKTAVPKSILEFVKNIES